MIVAFPGLLPDEYETQKIFSSKGSELRCLDEKERWAVRASFKFMDSDDLDLISDYWRTCNPGFLRAAQLCKAQNQDRGSGGPWPREVIFPFFLSCSSTKEAFSSIIFIFPAQCFLSDFLILSYHYFFASFSIIFIFLAQCFLLCNA